MNVASAASSLLGCMRKSTANKGKQSVPRTITTWDHVWSAMPIPGHASERLTLMFWSKLSEGPQRWLKDCSTWQKLGELWLFSMKGRKFSNVWAESVNTWWMERESRPFSVVPSERRGSECNLKYRKFHLNMRQKFLRGELSNAGTNCPVMLWSFHSWI